MSCILALETATDCCSVALWINGAVHERSQLAPRQHVALLLPFVDALLDECGISTAQLDAVAFGRGPGSFTGLRIAAGMAQGIAFGVDVPVQPVSTLAALAQGVLQQQTPGRILAALDARMGEVYWGVYRCGDDGLVSAEGEERVISPEHTPVAGDHDRVGVGDGWSTYADVLMARHRLSHGSVFADMKPQAAGVARLAAAAFDRGESLPAELAAPIYLRNNVADKPRPGK